MVHHQNLVKKKLVEFDKDIFISGLIFICITFSAQSSTVITVNQGVRGGKVIELKKTVDTAVQSCPTVRQVFVAMRTENPVVMTAKDILMEEVRQQKARTRLGS